MLDDGIDNYKSTQQWPDLNQVKINGITPAHQYANS